MGGLSLPQTALVLTRCEVRSREVVACELLLVVGQVKGAASQPHASAPALSRGCRAELCGWGVALAAGAVLWCFPPSVALISQGSLKEGCSFSRFTEVVLEYVQLFRRQKCVLRSWVHPLSPWCRCCGTATPARVSSRS